MNKALLLACLVLTFIASCAESVLVVALFGIPGILCAIALVGRLNQKKNRPDNSQSGAHEKDNIGLISVYQTSIQISRGILS